MIGLVRWLGLRPRRRGHVGERAARDAAGAYLCAQGIDLSDRIAADLTWAASGRAVWRFALSGQVPGAPAAVLELDARTGDVIGWRVHPR